MKKRFTSCSRYIAGRQRLAAALAVWLTSACGMDRAEARTLNMEFDTPIHDYRMHYWNADNSDTNWFTSDASAETVSKNFDRDGTATTGNPLGAHAGYIDLGFRTPDFSSEPGVNRDIRFEHDTNPNSTRSRIIMPPWLILDQGAGSAAIRQVCVHELFHNVEYAYTGNSSYFASLGKFATEGMATAAMDMLYSDDDDELRVSDWAYMAWAVGYLSQDTDEYIFSHSDPGQDGYIASLFWKYILDQYGADRVEPHTGHDVIERFWEMASNKDDSRYTILSSVLAEKDRYTTAAPDPGVSLEKTFQDFSVACWLRRYKNGFVSGNNFTMPDPGRFYFLDEFTGHTNFYNSGRIDNYPDNDYPSNTASYVLLPENATPQVTRSLRKWSSQFLVCDFNIFASNLGTYGIGFWAESDPNEKCWYSLAGVRQNGDIDFVSQSTVDPDAGNQFHYALMQTVTNPYKRLIAVVNGYAGESKDGFTDLTPEYSSYFSYFRPTLNIKDPSTNYPAYVGDYFAPERFVIRMTVTSPNYLGSGSLKGLRPESFKVYVGTTMLTQNEAKVLSAADMFGEYWITVQAPVRAAQPPSAQSLTVMLGDVQQTLESAVLYEKLDVDQMLVIDRSGSMSKTSGGISRNAASRSASQLFVDATGSDDQLGIVRFNGDNGAEPPGGTNLYDDAEVIWPMVKMSNALVRALTQYLVDETNPADPLLPSGSTSIGDGLYWGAKNILDRGRPGAEKWVILLSDGHQNEQTDYDDQAALYSAAGIKVQSIALGPNCDDGLLQGIATRTGGRFYKVEADEDASPSPSSLTSYPNGNMMLALADAYLSIHEDVKRKSRLLETTIQIPAGSEQVVPLTITEGGLKDALITAFFPTSGADIGLRVTDPLGATLPATVVATNYLPEYHVAYRLSSMTNGTWQFAITNGEATSQKVMLTVSAYNRQGARAQLLFTQYHGDMTSYANNGFYLVGLPMPISLTLNDAQGPIRGATVYATISHPLKPDVVIRLRDDGNGLDGTADDGVYAGLYRATTEGTLTGGSYAENSPPPPLKGSYRIAVTASGKDNFGQTFERVKRGSFHVYRQEQFGEDQDGDGMVDRYEDLHPCLDKLASNSLADADADGVPNGVEYNRGTHPCLPDSDGGGESDGSEFARGANPLDHTDDVLSPMIFAEVLTHPGDTGVGLEWLATNRNVILVSFESGQATMRLFRSTSPTGSYTQVVDIPRSSGGLYLDDGLTNGVTYYYRVQPLSSGGQTGVLGDVFSGTPKSDPIPPAVSISLPDGGKVLTNAVSVTLYASADAVQMRYGLSKDLSAIPWTNFSNRFAASLGAVSPGDMIPLYVQVRDAVDNRGTARAFVHVLDTNMYGAASGTVIMPLDTSNRGGDLVWSKGGEKSWGTTRDSGGFTHALKAGTYDLSISQRGYAPISVTGIVVHAGSVTNLGLFTLTPTDRDADGIDDVLELRDYGTDRDRADTDGDGFDDATELFRTRTVPTNALSAMRLIPSPASSADIVKWISSSGLIYRVYSLDNLLNTNWVFRGAVTGNAMTTESTYVDPTALPASNRFYRITLP